MDLNRVEPGPSGGAVPTRMDNGAQRCVVEAVDRMNLSRQEKARLSDELQNPLGLQQIVAEVSGTEAAIEAYAASLIAISECRPEAYKHLRPLARALKLPAKLVEAVHQQVAEARSRAAVHPYPVL